MFLYLFQRRKIKLIIETLTWPTRVLISVFLNRLSLCSVTRICCLMISAEVIGRLALTGIGTVNEYAGLFELDP